MKKVLLVLLALIMVLSMVTTAVAVPGNGMPPGQAKKAVPEIETNAEAQTETAVTYFEDLFGFGWAEEQIEFMAERGVIKGEGRNKFVPNRSTKEIEVLIMLIRMMGKEDDLNEDAILPSWLKDKETDDWMTPYIALADELFFAENSDFHGKFKPNAAASREVTALYISWALDNLSEEDIEDLGIDIEYLDNNEVGSEYQAAVQEMRQRGLMIGYRNKFQPKKPITRAECAVLMHRIFNMYDFNFNFGDNDVVVGELIDIDFVDGTDSTPEAIEINIYNNDYDSEFDLTEDAKAYDEDNELIDFDDLDDDYIGDIVKLLVNEDGDVFKVFVIEVDMTEGNLEDFDYSGDEINWIEVENKYGTEIFDNITPEAIVLVEGIDDEDLPLETELLDLNVALEFEDDVVVEIKIEGKLVGTLVDIYEDDNQYFAEIIPEFEIDDSDYPTEYQFDESALVKVNGNTEELDNLKEMDLDETNVKVIFDITYDDDEYDLLIKKMYITTN